MANQFSFIYIVDRYEGPEFFRFQKTDGEIERILNLRTWSSGGPEPFRRKVSKAQVLAIQQALKTLHD